MADVRNILFIMCDQLRWDYLSCSGHPHLKTPNIDRLARMGVRFDRAFVNAPVCGPSRMSFYTGRTVFSHGATWNHVPLPIGELTIGDYLMQQGVRVAVAGKTHIREDSAGRARLGLTPHTDIDLIVSQGSIEPWERDDGVHPPRLDVRGLAYNRWLNALGYDGDNPWDTWANAGEGPGGAIMSGWELRNSIYPARIREEHSETPYITTRGLEFMADCRDTPWLLHLSYIKPHWPYIAPRPYFGMYTPEHVVPAVKHERERADPHPVYKAFMDMEIGRSFAREDVRAAVIPAYMGLIHQIDDQIGRVLAWLETSGRIGDTMIVFTSDHGDYLGDHWLGEKELFHEPSVRVPLIIVDPSQEADATRGTVRGELVEAIDLVPTFLDACRSKVSRHRLEGRSLLPLVRGATVSDWRDSVLSELDYAFYEARELTHKGANDARAFMLRTARWKYLYFKGFRPQLFDLQEDPGELVDLGDSGGHEAIRLEMHGRLLERLTDRRNRVTVDDQWVLDAREREMAAGIIIGRW
jgi:arylsulfatase A-like enzyme